MNYGYCRQSTDMQMSIDMQLSLVQDLAARHDRELAKQDVLTETASATTTPYNKRPEFSKLMQMVKPGDWLFVWRMDRIERNPFKLPQAMEWLMKENVVICSHMEGVIDLSTIHGRMMVYGQQMVCDMFKTYLSEATSAGLNWRKENGFAYNANRFGRKRVVVRTAKRGGKTLKADVWDSGELHTIREIYRRNQAGETLSAIAEDFYRRKLMTANGKLWCPKVRSTHSWCAFKVCNESRVRSAFAWYKKLADLGIEPEYCDPNITEFLGTKRNPMPESQKQVIAQAKERARLAMATFPPHVPLYSDSTANG